MEVRGDLESLLYVMTKLGAKFPLAGTSPIPPSTNDPQMALNYLHTAYHAAKVQGGLDGE